MASQLFGWGKAAAVGRASGALVKALDKVVKRYAIEAGEKAKPMCPVRYGILQKSLTASVDYNGRAYPQITGKQVEDMTYLVGSGLPYAAKMEYEHKTKNMFLHKSIEKIKKPMKEEAAKLLKVVLSDAWTKG